MSLESANLKTCRARRGFTLVEVLLALGLMTLVIASIVIAIQLYMVTLRNQQRQIERLQLSRSVLAMIASDLRAAFQHKPADVTGLKEMQASQMAAFGLSALGVDGEMESGAADSMLDQMGFQPGYDIAQAGVPAPRPGLYGNQHELMVDISRLPRLDELNLGGNQSSWMGSDMRTVAYFVQQGGASQAQADAFGFSREEGLRGGLFRREVNRALGNSANELHIDLDQHTRLIAPEVFEIHFQYFDGYQWLPEWDSDAMGGFPAAIEVVIGVDIFSRERAKVAARQMQGQQHDDELTYHRVVVHLPAAEILSQEELMQMMNMVPPQ